MELISKIRPAKLSVVFKPLLPGFDTKPIIPGWGPTIKCRLTTKQVKTIRGLLQKIFNFSDPSILVGGLTEVNLFYLWYGLYTFKLSGDNSILLSSQFQLVSKAIQDREITIEVIADGSNRIIVANKRLRHDSEDPFHEG